MSASPARLHLHLKDHDATIVLGVCFADAMRALGVYPALLLDGELGAGKTTFVRGVVQALPGGEQAEAASPSFNYLNIYPTSPEMFHFDFYRLRGQELDDDLFSALHDPMGLVVVEWASFCRSQDLPAEYLALRFSMCANGREVAIYGHGDQAALIIQRLGDAIPAFFFTHDSLQGVLPTCGL